MPPRGVRKGTKRAREYQHIKASVKKRGASEKKAEEIAARTVNKDRARAGESRTRSKVSLRGKSPAARGGQRSGTNRPKGRTREQLYEEAKRMNVPGRSTHEQGPAAARRRPPQVVPARLELSRARCRARRSRLRGRTGAGVRPGP